jgi:hypothetical protein
VIPPVVVLTICPACGKPITVNYTLDTFRSSCTKTIHRAAGVSVEYVQSTVAVDSVHGALKDGFDHVGPQTDEELKGLAAIQLRSRIDIARRQARR